MHTNADPMMVRIKARHDTEVRQRRSLVAGTFTALCVWIVAGFTLYGVPWLNGVLFGIGIAMVISFGMTIKALIYVNNLEAASGAWEENARQSRRLMLSALTGNMIVCVIVFAGYQSCLDFGTNREKTLAIAAVTTVSFVVAYILASKVWTRFCSKDSERPKVDPNAGTWDSEGEMPISPEARDYLAQLMWDAAENDPEMREVLDDALLELQTDLPPNGEDYRGMQDVRDELGKMGGEASQ